MTSPPDDMFGKLRMPDTSGIQDSLERFDREAWLQRKREASAAEASVTTSQGIAELVKAANEAEAREKKMLHWTIAGVVLAGIAAVAGIVAVVVTVVLA